MVSGGDGCISWDDAKKPLEEQFQDSEYEAATMTAAEKKEEEATKDHIEDEEPEEGEEEEQEWEEEGAEEKVTLLAKLVDLTCMF